MPSGKIILAGLFLILLGFGKTVLAQTEDLNRQIEELKQKIDAAQNEVKSLNSQIRSMDNQITLAKLKIEKTSTDIARLEDEISELNDKIEKLDRTLDHLVYLFSLRVANNYQEIAKSNNLLLLLSAQGFTDFLNRAKYIQAAQAHDQEMMLEMQSTKVDYNTQKDRREVKKKEQEILKKELEDQKSLLDRQIKAKQALLEQTKNNESTYQKLLEQALAEKQAIEAALINGEKVGPVKKGDPIALMGNTGYPNCSTGTHLHFEIRKNNQWVDPGDYLKSLSLTDQQNGGNSALGKGDWDWPLSGDIILTQHYGRTPYSWRYSYSGGVHTGLDLFTYDSAVIRAPKDGTLYSSSESCGSSVIKIKYIDHGDGLLSLYLHVQ